MTTEELNKMTKKKLIALYEEMTGGPIGFSVKNKEEAVRMVKGLIRSKKRGKAFSEYV